MKARLQTLLIVIVALIGRTEAQVTPAGGYTPPDDAPNVKVGGTIFADYTYVDSPTAKDTAGRTIHQSSFNVGRAYLNITGSVFHLVSYRITPDIARETGSGASLSGSQNFRLKYAYGQLNLDDWTNKGSFVRLGVQQTPFVDYEEGVYRYRFQGPVFVDREGFSGSSDAGLSAKWVFPGGYGDIHGGLYNGEGYSRAEVNDEKAAMVRATVRPFPLGGVWKGLRLTGFAVSDAPVGGGRRDRLVANAIFEHPRFNAGADWLAAKDRALPASVAVNARGWSVWITPKLTRGFELLLRHDELEPNSDTSQERSRNIFGAAYWLPTPKGTSAAVLVDYDSLRQKNFSAARPDDTRYGLKLLISF